MAIGLSERDLLQRVTRKLIDEYGYSSKQMKFEVEISGRLVADCVIYSDERKRTPLIVIEIKSPLHYPLGTDQLAKIMQLSGAHYGFLTDGVEKFCFRLAGKEIMEILDIPKRYEEEAKVPSKQELKPGERLDYKLQKIYDYIWRSEKLPPESALEEMQKLLLCKLEDERSPDEVPLFWMNPNEVEEMARENIQEAVVTRMNSLFDMVKKRHPQLYAESESFRLSPHTLSYCIVRLQNYSLSKASADVISAAYPQFISKSMYGYLSQYFTPKPLIDCIVELLDPSKEEKVLDPACGSGGFLISVMHYVWKNKVRLEAPHYSDEITKYSKTKIFGIDVDPKMVSICKMNMLIQGDGHANMFLVDFLSDLSHIDEIKPESFDIVVVDPPLASRIYDQNVLRNYKLGVDRKSQQIDVLFLEKCVDMIKPEGRMAVIVSERLLTSPSLDHVREFLLGKMLVRAIISFPAQAYHGQKTSTLLMQKKEKKRKYRDYDVFMTDVFDMTKETLDGVVSSYRRFERMYKHGS